MAQNPPKGITYRGPLQYQWRVRVRGIYANGVKDTLEGAVAAREDARQRINAGTWDDGQRLRSFTLAKGLDYYEEHVLPHKKGGDKERSRLKTWREWHGGAKGREGDWLQYPMSSIMPDQIQAFIDERQRAGSGSGASTIRNCVAVLSSVFRSCRTRLHLDIPNPCLLVSLPPPPPPRHVTLPASDAVALLAACREGPDYLIHCVLIAIETAMRAGEIRRIQRSHVHKTHVHLPKTKNPRGGVVRARDVPLTEEAEGVISDAMKALPHRPDGWLFGDPEKWGKDGGFTESMLSNAFAAAVKRARGAGLTKSVRFHDLRHIAITELAKDHAGAMELAKLTGHRTLRVLTETYYNPTPLDQAAELRRRRAERKAREKAA
ncbi:site-specific integrase [Gluconobacter sp. R75690]|uniref:tyrosine-type recombinase/integrase n=1 Tax=unclassified Gluconobacter TaxID=2644261 RepID=UPI00188B6EDC|nr:MULTISPECIES: site-specific integrase [unclassified Gluconobacter]MBF0850123.1 site-specific integrase [Gluconobacter sp. R75690]MBF0879042.1 site-specific integrase [Gluconobacter sp. R75828]